MATTKKTSEAARCLDAVGVVYRQERLFKANVKRLCRPRGRQREVAEAAGITPEYLSEMLRGTSSPTMRVMVRLSLAVGVPLAVLLTKQIKVKK